MRFAKAALRLKSHYTAALLLVAMALALPGTPSVAAPARQPADENTVGPVEALALENSGNGWAWADFAPQKPGTNYLLSVQNGTWTIAADSTTDPSLLPPGLTVVKMALTADGTGGWAIANTFEGNALLWRYQAGVWNVMRLSPLPRTLAARDMSISADGTDGWLSLSDESNTQYAIFRLRNGTWRVATQPIEGKIEHVAISADGKSAWASGPYSTAGTEAIYRLVEDAWASPPVKMLPGDQRVTALATGNSGHGWAITANSLLSLDPNSGVSVAYTAPDKVTLSALAVDAAGRGWALGAKDLGQVEEPSVIRYLREAVIVRLDGSKATEVKAADVSFAPHDVAPHSLALTPGGGHAWAGARTDIGYGRLITFREPWPYSSESGGKGPAGLAPLPGRDRCFAQVRYCLRGKFLDFWEKNGGIEQLGLPITTEINESIGGKEYLVQYAERARLEYHPENQGKAGEVLLGLLGNTLADARQNETPFVPTPAPANPVGGTLWFRETSHNTGPPFLAYWQSKGGLPVFGYPRSEAFQEVNQADGKSYLVQYFERNRIEYHPENAGTQYEYLLGLLGAEQFKARYGFTP